MGDKLTPEQLEEWRDLASKATKGPWVLGDAPGSEPGLWQPDPTPDDARDRAVEESNSATRLADLHDECRVGQVHRAEAAEVGLDRALARVAELRGALFFAAMRLDHYAHVCNVRDDEVLARVRAALDAARGQGKVGAE